jgi:hypothetical protein
MAISERRHPLLIYVRLFAPWRIPALLITLLCLALAWLAPGPLAEEWMRIVLVAGAAASLLLFVYALVGPRLSYVQCRPTHLRVSTPLFQLAISYNRIYTARPVPFEPKNVSWTQESLARPFLGMTMLALDLNGYPVSKRWLQFLLNPFMLPDNFLGLQLLVQDWMGLSRDIEVHRSQWKTRHQDRSRGDALTSLTIPRR